MDFRKLIPFGRKNIEVRREDDNPFAVMQREMDRMFDVFNRTWGFGAFPVFPTAVIPRLDVAEDAKAFTVTAELPGMLEKDIDLSISGDTLTIRGEKKEEIADKNRNYCYSERSYGSILRSVPVPKQVDTDRISASFKKGILTITLPKTAQALEVTRKIQVRAA